MKHRLRYRLYRHLRWLRDNVWAKYIGPSLATWLYKRHPEWCWADLWTDVGLGWYLAGWDRCKDTGHCKRDAQRCGYCYCGKFTTEEFLKQWSHSE